LICRPPAATAGAGWQVVAFITHSVANVVNRRVIVRACVRSFLCTIRVLHVDWSALCHSEYLNIKKLYMNIKTHTKSALGSYERDTYAYVTYTATLHLALVCHRCSASGTCQSTSTGVSGFIHLHTPN
jgi:hypothetical protein